MLLLGAGCGPDRISEQKLQRFEHILESFRSDLKIPGMAAVIIKDQRVVWTRGFGYADMSRKIEATPRTPFHLASITKPIAATIFLQLREQHVLDLEDPLIRYGMVPGFGNVRLKHLLTHTSDKDAGTTFRYSGYRYGFIGVAMKRATGKSFRTLLEDRIIQPLQMENTAPNLIDPELLERFFSYIDEKKSYSLLRNDRNAEYELCSLYDYFDPLYDTTYALASNLVAHALENGLIESNLFRITQMLPIDAASTRKFNEFWLSDNRYLRIYRNLSRPYDLDSMGNIVSGQYSMFFNPAAGLISSVEDLAKFDIALDENRLISEESRELAFTPTSSPSNERFPHGIGWFVQEYDGVKLIWHGGEWDCTSALYLKVPEEELTFIVLANARSMSGGFSMGEGDVLNSGVGLAFLRLFVFEEKYGEIGPDIGWKAFSAEIVEEIRHIKSDALKELYRRQLQNMETMFLRMGPIEIFHELVRGVHPFLMVQEEFSEAQMGVIAKIADVGNSEHRVADFKMGREGRVRVFCVGEAWEGDEFDYGWIESTMGDTVWKMEVVKSEHAGGSVKNRMAEETIYLPSGRYRLHYESDSSHSYGNWNAAPPDQLFWGIVVYGDE
jgi:CubicO group peptidase (beta-lactamase class C family)